MTNDTERKIKDIQKISITDLISLGKTLDTEKTNKRICYELPNCNWLEDKIKDIEFSRKQEQNRKYTNDRR